VVVIMAVDIIIMGEIIVTITEALVYILIGA
jgi:hypothetical protein